jgi:hypothetical protein
LGRKKALPRKEEERRDKTTGSTTQEYREDAQRKKPRTIEMKISDINHKEDGAKERKRKETAENS